MDALYRHRPRGRPKTGEDTTKVTLCVEPHLSDWGKRRPGGLSLLVRQLLRDAYEKEKQALTTPPR